MADALIDSPREAGALPVVEEDEAGEADEKGQVEADEAAPVVGPKMDIFHMGHGLQKWMFQQFNLSRKNLQKRDLSGKLLLETVHTLYRRVQQFGQLLAKLISRLVEKVYNKILRPV